MISISVIIISLAVYFLTCWAQIDTYACYRSTLKNKDELLKYNVQPDSVEKFQENFAHSMKRVKNYKRNALIFNLFYLACVLAFNFAYIKFTQAHVPFILFGGMIGVINAAFCLGFLADNGESMKHSLMLGVNRKLYDKEYKECRELAAKEENSNIKKYLSEKLEAAGYLTTKDLEYCKKEDSKNLESIEKFKLEQALNNQSTAAN